MRSAAVFILSPDKNPGLPPHTRSCFISSVKTAPDSLDLCFLSEFRALALKSCATEPENPSAICAQRSLVRGVRAKGANWRHQLFRNAVLSCDGVTSFLLRVSFSHDTHVKSGVRVPEHVLQVLACARHVPAPLAFHTAELHMPTSPQRGHMADMQ